MDNKIDGAVLMLLDVDTLRRAREYAESIVATVREPLLVLDADLRVQDGQPVILPHLQDGARGNGRPFPLRSWQRPVEHLRVPAAPRKSPSPKRGP